MVPLIEKNRHEQSNPRHFSTGALARVKKVVDDVTTTVQKHQSLLVEDSPEQSAIQQEMANIATLVQEVNMLLGQGKFMGLRTNKGAIDFSIARLGEVRNSIKKTITELKQKIDIQKRTAQWTKQARIFLEKTKARFEVKGEIYTSADEMHCKALLQSPYVSEDVKNGLREILYRIVLNINLDTCEQLLGTELEESFF